MNSVRVAFAPHLPFLRRYARALAGSQAAGDADVRTALEALLDNPGLINLRDGDGKLELFRLFHVVRDARERTGREALLLSAIEGFSLQDTAHILGSSESAVGADITDARAGIMSAIRSRVLIIEDEPIIAMHLEQIVADMGHEPVANAITHDEAVREAERVAPDLVLADIQLADGSSGIDAANEILQRFDVPVIFITAYPERLLTGERPEPAYLVTKPFQPETVIATIGQALLSRQGSLAPA
ncbi:response regulator [Sandaracinobacter neustonicus]|uniref:Response regulator n=2 Tax=Sandaracinobacter neustonicus TaxID=1715348 RepID=A0A501XUB1_9SPHN|nr:response regulator [Sandaracinobacter neustonicus]